MTTKQIEIIKNLKIGQSVTIGRVVIKRDRGQYNIAKDRFVRSYKESEFHLLSEKVDELNTEVIQEEKIASDIPGTNLTKIKTLSGYEVYENGKVIQKDLSEKDLNLFVQHYKNLLDQKKVGEARKKLVTEHKISKQKKTLYYFILVLSTALLITTYVLGVKFDGVTIKRTNQKVYTVVTEIAEAKYPGKKFDKFDATYYTLNYYAHEQHYFALAGEELVIDSYYSKVTPEELRNKSLDTSYSGIEFNNYFKDALGVYVSEEETIRRISYILGRNETNAIVKIDELIEAYLIWDVDDNRSNVAYNWDAVNKEGRVDFNVTTDYYKRFLRRNNFVKLFLDDESKFVHEYNMLESVGWLNWTTLAISALYIILAFSIWVFKRDNLKISKGLIIVILVLTAIIVIPLLLQYLFEGLSKEATQFLDIIENTRFTTSTTLMNFIFDYIMKFSNLILTAILTIALPLKVVRYFVFNAVSKLDTSKKITRNIGKGMSVTEEISRVDWRG